MALKVQQVQLGNCWVTYSLEGNANHPAILFLHGFMGAHDQFKQVTANLSKQFYCVAIDLLGHGQTHFKDQDIDQEHYYRIEATANIVIEFLDFLRLNNSFLVGYSMGGRLALYLAIHFPKYFQKVVLESASAGLRTATERGDRLAKDRGLAIELENSDLTLFLERWYQQPIFANMRSHPDFPQMLKQRLNNSPAGLAKCLRNLSTGIQPSLWGNLSEITIPLLLLAGELDFKFVQINQQMEQLCKYAKLVVIPNCSHNIHFENPDLFVKQIQIFL